MARRASLEYRPKHAEAPAPNSAVAAHSTLLNPPSGAPLDGGTAARLEAALGHDFSSVRVHADESADALARELDARALTSGSHLYFRAGEYAPATTEGMRVLAHEATHVVQQAAGQVSALSDGAGMAENADPSTEHAADTAASAVLGGDVAPRGHSAPTLSASVGSVVQRWPWSDDEEKKPEAAPAPSSSIWDSLNSAGTAIYKAESAAWDGTKSAASAASGAYNSVAPDFKKDNKNLGDLVDMGEAAAKKGSAQAVAEYGDIPVLGSLVKASAFMSDLTTDATGGVVKGVGDLASMAGTAMFHPIDAVSDLAGGALGMAEHVPFIPGLNTTAKGLHGLYDLATGKPNAEYGNSLGELGENLLMGTHTDPNDPSKKSNADLDFAAGIGGGTKVWKEKPAEAATRTITNLLPMLLGDEGGIKPGETPPPVPEVPVGAPVVDPFGVTQPAFPAVKPPTSPLATTGAFPAAPELPVGAPPVDPFGATQPAFPAVDPLGATQPAFPAVEPPTSPLATTGAFPEGAGTRPVAATVDMPAVNPSEVGSAGMKGKTLPPFDPNAPVMEQLAWGVKTFEPGQINFSNPLQPGPPPTVFDHLPFGYEPPPGLPFGKGYKLPVPYGDLGLPVGPDGSLDLSKLMQQYKGT